MKKRILLAGLISVMSVCFVNAKCCSFFCYSAPKPVVKPIVIIKTVPVPAPAPAPFHAAPVPPKPKMHPAPAPKTAPKATPKAAPKNSISNSVAPAPKKSAPKPPANDRYSKGGYR